MMLKVNTFIYVNDKYTRVVREDDCGDVIFYWCMPRVFGRASSEPDIAFDKPAQRYRRYASNVSVTIRSGLYEDWLFTQLA